MRHTSPAHRLRSGRFTRRRGMALVCALMMMLGTLILAVSIARTAFGAMASSRLERERVLALAAAEAALADAEADIAGGSQPSSARAAWFAAGSGGFAAGCGHGSQDLGLCLPAAAPLPALWQTIDLADQDAPLVPLGLYTGAALALGGGILPARLPAYLVERLDGAGAGPPSVTLYRITAIGFGTRAANRVVLQALYRKTVSGAPPPAGASEETDPPAEPVPGAGIAVPAAPAEPVGPTAPAAPAGTPGLAASTGRIGWREVANWPELHARALQ